MNFVETIRKYFPGFTDVQYEAFLEAGNAYRAWNGKINVISRKDMDNLALRHFVHSLSMLHFHRFYSGRLVLDVGTGGGFPGIPLAIAYPDVNFLLIDSIGKKLQVARAVAEAAGLKNVEIWHGRVENSTEKADYVTGRAVENAESFFSRVLSRLLPYDEEKPERGVYYFTGPQELKKSHTLKRKPVIYKLAPHFQDETWFSEKQIIFFPIQKG